MRTSLNHLASALLLLFAGRIPTVAQDEIPSIEVFAGYAYLRTDASEGRVNLNGWNIALEKNLNRILGLTADFDGAYGSQLGERISAHSVLFGPRLTARRTRVQLFTHALFGCVREAEARDVHYGFGMNLGGGLDYEVNRRISFRLAQADYQYNRVNVLSHHNILFAAGLVLKFGEMN